ncbi:MAG: hypothetical protein L0Y44_13000, partial [Phycisphaerales bacterium]|nr:hypothetical protein [Phycisphaerales bacterium]MCI0631561.1 hypothetical protein [Phycisphaerales bacterium]MCI0676821.1 hypothetical protein [Phycisphaerales bacterium]
MWLSRLVVQRMMGVATALAATLNLAGHAQVTKVWINPAGGSFQDDLNWSPVGVPGPLDIAMYDILGAYTVTFAQNAAAQALVNRGDDVTLDLAPFQCTLNGLMVGDESGGLGKLLLLNGNVDVTGKGTLVRVGVDFTDAGELTINSPAQLTSTQPTVIGDGGNGSLVLAGGTFAAGMTTMADDALSVGSALVQAGATWSNSSIVIGNAGAGSLSILTGGSVTTNSAFVGD